MSLKETKEHIVKKKEGYEHVSDSYVACKMLNSSKLLFNILKKY